MLADGVQEGRQIFVNLKRSIQYVLASGVLVSGHGSNVHFSQVHHFAFNARSHTTAPLRGRAHPATHFCYFDLGYR